MGPQGYTVVTVPVGHPGDAGVSQVFYSGATWTYCSCISVAVEPQGDTVVELTVSDGGYSDTLMSVEYLMVVALLHLCH